jgi:hypothetical protein
MIPAGNIPSGGPAGALLTTAGKNKNPTHTIIPKVVSLFIMILLSSTYGLLISSTDTVCVNKVCFSEDLIED